MIPTNHPARFAIEWDDSLLNDLPDPLLRWFAADCAERACLADGNVNEASIRAIITARLHAMGMATDQDLDAAHTVCDTVTYRSAHRAAVWAAYWAAQSAAQSAEERSWQLARLRYLICVWQTCGERSAHLLHIGECPIEWEDFEPTSRAPNDPPVTHATD